MAWFQKGSDIDGTGSMIKIRKKIVAWDTQIVTDQGCFPIQNLLMTNQNLLLKD